MNILLLFFALPIAVIIFSIALQKIFKNPILVASIIFAIFLVTTIAIGDLTYLIATIIYTIIAYIVAVLTCILDRIINRKINNNEGNNSDNLATQNDVNNILQAINNINCNGNLNCSCRRRFR